MKFLERIEKVIKSFEDSKTPFVYFILTFLSAITLRNFLEIFSTGIVISQMFFSHFNVFYISLALSLVILFHFATKEKIEKISRVILPCFLILIIVPIIDLVVNNGSVLKISYIIPEKIGDLLLDFFTFFSSDFSKGISFGIKLELTLVILGSFIYFYIKRKNLIRSLFFSFLVYALIFFYLSTPFFIKEYFELINQGYNYSPLFLRNFYLLPIFILLFWIFYISNKEYFLEILKDIRFFRLIHFDLMFIFGIIVALLSSVNLGILIENRFFYFNLIFVLISILFAWLFSVTTNNLADYKIDKTTNKERPLVAGKITEKEYKCLAAIFFILSIVYSGVVNFEIFFLIILFIANYFLYSMPPLRLKRVPFFSKLFISLNSLIILMIGYFLMTESLRISGDIIFFFLVFLTAVFNFIDLKDYEGDKKEGIKTLPVIFGLKRSKEIIGLFFLISYLAAWVIIIKDISLFPHLLFLGFVQFFLINRKNYREKPVFLVYFLTMLLLTFYFSKVINFKMIGI